MSAAEEHYPSAIELSLITVRENVVIHEKHQFRGRTVHSVGSKTAYSSWCISECNMNGKVRIGKSAGALNLYQSPTFCNYWFLSTFEK